MGNQQLEISWGDARLVQGPVDQLFHLGDGELVDLASTHVHGMQVLGHRCG